MVDFYINKTAFPLWFSACLGLSVTLQKYWCNSHE